MIKNFFSKKIKKGMEDADMGVAGNSQEQPKTTGEKIQEKQAMIEAAKKAFELAKTVLNGGEDKERMAEITSKREQLEGELQTLQTEQAAYLASMNEDAFADRGKDKIHAREEKAGV
jgi:hypothetical protein